MPDPIRKRIAAESQGVCSTLRFDDSDGMQKLYYASGYLLVGDAVCEALMEYAKALADVGRSDVVNIPALSDEGIACRTQLLIGPASQLFAAAAADRGADLDDDQAVQSMRAKAANLRPSSPVIGDTREGDFRAGADYL